jgi:aspartokinase/homoserine dehydrogenase 1
MFYIGIDNGKEKQMKILKFGGSSLATPEKIKNVINIVLSFIKKKETVHIVVSAFQKVTDQLIDLAKTASKGDITYQELYKQLREKHISYAKTLISAKNQSHVIANLINYLNELEDVVHGVYLVKELSFRTLDFIMGFGERLSAFIISEIMNDQKIECDYLDSRNVVLTDESFGSAKVNFEKTNENIADYFSNHHKTQIITGFIGTTQNGETTTLGRSGSDYTASIFAAALAAKEIEIWTDVEGVMTANPLKVDKAVTISHMTYEEAMELSHFGANVIHPSTMQPALDKNIPLRIRNTFNPSFIGTVISDKDYPDDFLIKGISSIDDISLIRIQGSGMVGVAGIARRIFGALANEKINIILITQASSEHSICLAVLPNEARKAKKSIEDELKYEIRERMVDEVIIESDFSIIAVVGEHMRKTTGLAGSVFQTLGKNGINIHAIAQGSSERNISVVVSRNDEAKALNALHDNFFLSQLKTINMFLIGPGLIGSTLLKQIRDQKEFLEQEYSLQLNLVALADINKMKFKPEGISLTRWDYELSNSSKKTNVNNFVKKMIELNLPNSIFIDCTASEEVAKNYKRVLEANISIVTPNKIANSGNFEDYHALKKIARKHNVKFAYEANVGAGLPIINTLKDLISSGDKILKIEGVLSGTLSYVFNSFMGGMSFSDAVKEAKEKGYTEPDPREDLMSSDVARKLLILAREIGMNLEYSDIKIESLLPEPASDSEDIVQFFELLKSYDSIFAEKRNNAKAKGNVLRYVASLEDGKAEISMQEVGPDHPFYMLSGSDNILALKTQNYHDRSLVVQGPGAGAEVTASAVFADLIRISNYLT